MSEPSSNKKTLILVRHAHRLKLEGGDADNGLSDKGRKQAKRAAKRFRAYFDGQQALFVTSPKRRCLETLVPFVDSDRGKLQINADLGEGGPLDRKVERFIAWWREKAPDLVVACSHGDWIPLALKALTGAEIALKKGGWAELEMGAGDECARLVWLIQEL